MSSVFLAVLHTTESDEGPKKFTDIHLSELTFMPVFHSVCTLPFFVCLSLFLSLSLLPSLPPSFSHSLTHTYMYNDNFAFLHTR